MNRIQDIWRQRALPFLRNSLFSLRGISTYSSRRVGNDYSGDIHMFVEDMYLSIMPFSSQRDSQLMVKLEPDNQELERIISDALDTRGHQHRLSDALADFVRNTVRSLFIYEKVLYRIVYATNTNGRVNSLEFIYPHPLSIRKIFGNYYQTSPWPVAEVPNQTVSVKKIPREEVLLIEFPKELGGKRTLRKIIKRLSVLGKEIAPDFYMEVVQKNQDIGFSLGKYAKAKFLEKAQLTKRFGWNQRRRSDEEILEYYYLYRHLYFALSLAIIRENIIETINHILNGPLLNFGAKIIVEGIPTAQQIRDEFEILESGNVEFGDLYKRTNL